MSLIKIKNVSFAYENKEVLKNISIDIESGKLYCFMGTNGCGKSTLIDCILGVNKIRNGEISICGKDVYNYKSKELAKKIAYVPQVHDRSFPYTVQEIVLMGRTVHTTGMNSPDKNDEKIAENALQIVGIEHLKSRPYTQISGGEMQLVMLARALVQETSVIIMDEPTAHLDFKNELVFMETTLKLLKEKNSTALMATHSPNQAFYFENKGIDVVVVVINNGIVECIGKPSEVLTEENISNVYNINSKLICYEDKRVGNLKQIIPLKTV